MPYPYIAITFDSTKLAQTIEGRVDFGGDLVAHGVTKANHGHDLDGYSSSKYEIISASEAYSQLVRLPSREFNSVLTDVGVRRIRRSDEYAKPGDTLVWNRKAQEWRPIPDLSVYYRLEFDTAARLDEITEALKKVPGVIGATKIPIPVLDTCIVGGFGVYPNDDSVGRQEKYLLSRRSSGAGGAGIYCAWATSVIPDGSVRVGLMDHTVDTTHPDLTANWRITRSSLPIDHTHGTKNAGIIGATAGNDLGIAGIGWDVDGIAYDRFTHFSESYSYARQDSVDLIVSPYHLVNVDTTISSLDDEIYACYQAGIIIVASSGNAYLRPIPWPVYPAGFDDWVISVAAHTDDGAPHPASNYPCDTCNWSVDVAAHGENLYTTTTPDGGYAFINHTSAASSIVGGILALALANDDNLTFEFARQYLSSTAVPGASYSQLLMGGGNVDAEAVIHNLVFCCEGIRGDVNGDGSNADQIDLDYLVSFLFSGGPLPPCQHEGNVDGDPDETIGPLDLSYLVDYLYNGGSQPPACP